MVLSTHREAREIRPANVDGDGGGDSSSGGGGGWASCSSITTAHSSPDSTCVEEGKMKETEKEDRGEGGRRERSLKELVRHIKEREKA